MSHPFYNLSNVLPAPVSAASARHSVSLMQRECSGGECTSRPFLSGEISAANQVVEPHALRLEATAAEMDAAGLGEQGNALRDMAARMRADAAQGQGTISAAANNTRAVDGALRACRAAGVKVPASGKFTKDQLDAALDGAFDKNNALSFEKRINLKTQIHAAGMVASHVPYSTERNVAAAVKEAVRLLDKAGIARPTKYQFTMDELNAAMDKSGLDTTGRMTLKSSLSKVGMLDVTSADVPPLMASTPNVNAIKFIFAQLDLDYVAGKRLGLGTLNKAIADKDLSITRSMEIKATLKAAGMLAV